MKYKCRVTQPSRRSQDIPIFQVYYSADHIWDAERVLGVIAILVDFKQTMAVAVKSTGEIVDGNNVVRAMKILGLHTLRVVNADGLSVKHAGALRRRTNNLVPAADREYVEFLTLQQLD